MSHIRDTGLIWVKLSFTFSNMVPAILCLYWPVGNFIFPLEFFYVWFIEIQKSKALTSKFEVRLSLEGFCSFVFNLLNLTSSLFAFIGTNIFFMFSLKTDVLVLHLRCTYWYITQGKMSRATSALMPSRT